MTQAVYADHLTLAERLEAEGRTNPLCTEALQRIRTLETLCARMTDTGVTLEEDVQDLVQADTWWPPHDPECCYSSLQEAMAELALPGDIVEWGRAHTLSNGYAVTFDQLCDHTGKVVYEAGVREYDSYEAAEEASADHQLRKRRAEYRACCPVKIKDADMALGQPDDWASKDGEVEVLLARRAMYGSAPAMLSAWKPSVDELELLMRGGSIVLGIIGNEHPPVLMYASAED